MTDATEAFTIHFASDGYEPGRHGLNGRRMVGQSFLKAWIDQLGNQPLRACTRTPAASKALRNYLAARLGEPPKLKVTMLHEAAMLQAGTVFTPGVGLDNFAWGRMARRVDGWSLCGMTHTLATRNAMASIAALLHAPLTHWDAVICTSRAARAEIEAQFAHIDDYHRRRFGRPAAPEARPMLPVIPLGIDCDSFAPDPAQGQALRASLGVGADEILCATLGRLTIFGKFDPIPLFMAMQKAAARGGRKLHLALVGQFLAGTTAEDYHRTARLMPDLTLHLVDGSAPEMPGAAFSAADIFLFPIDNLQETFGLAPVEAMAAGLPVIATDWDGLRDTITPDCGFLVPTLAGRVEHSRTETLRYLTEADTELQFQSLHASMTSYDINEMARFIHLLSEDAELRARMGRAGQARARSLYDWKAILPQMRALWAEQNRIRLRDSESAAAKIYAGATVPVLPPAFDVFGSWPSQQLPRGGLRLAAKSDAPKVSLTEIGEMRRLSQIKRQIEPPETIAKLLGFLQATPGFIALEDLARALGMSVISAERCALWLVKCDLIELG